MDPRSENEEWDIVHLLPLLSSKKQALPVPHAQVINLV